jgi:signal transduction histidine kinase
MNRTRTLGLVALLVILGALLSLWAAREARLQRRSTEQELRAAASLVASSLVPALAAASSAARELDEIVAWKLLDNARLLARLDAAGALGEAELLRLLDDNGLDLVAFLRADGSVRRWAGSEDPTDLDAEGDLAPLLRGEADELILGWSSSGDHMHVAAAAAHPRGGLVLVRTDASTAYAYARRLGVASLLESTVGTGGVLYLSFHEHPGETTVEASWDGGPVPAAGEGESPLSLRGRSSFELDFPVPGPAGIAGSLRVGLDAAPLSRASTAAMRRTTLVGAVLAAFALAVLGFALVSRSRALERAEGARRVAELEEARRRSERLASAGALASGLAHEVRNPLNAISLAAQRIERSHRDDEVCQRFVSGIRGEVGRLDEILKGFLDLARPATGPRRSADLRELAQEVVGLLAPEAVEHDLVMAVHGEALHAVIDREAVRRALINLVRNAIEASPEASLIEVELEAEGGLARLRVLDQGPGPDPELGERVFDPFITGRAEGTGLGLSLVRRVGEEHGGGASLDSRPGGGAVATLALRLEEATS